MSGSSNNTQSNLGIPYSMPSGIPEQYKGMIKPIYIIFQNIVWALVNLCGIAPRSPKDILSSNGDAAAILANNVHRFYVMAAEAINYGAAVNLVVSGGNLFVQNANATTSAKPADGFCSNSGGIALGSIGELILSDGVVTGLVGLTPGARYYLSTVNGGYTSAAPVAAGNLQQSLGIALSATVLRFWTGNQIQH